MKDEQRYRAQAARATTIYRVTTITNTNITSSSSPAVVNDHALQPRHRNRVYRLHQQTLQEPHTAY